MLQRERSRPIPAPGTLVGSEHESSDRFDYDLHGLVGIRLVDASPEDVAAVSAQLGPIEAPLSREPDIVIRFVDRLPLSSPMRLLGVHDAGFTDDAFLVLRSKHNALVRVEIPLDTVGDRCEITCERGVPAVPLLIAVINLTALGNGALPVHASAFRYTGTGVLVTGWAKGGKTETLLGFLAHGAEYIGDEWVYLSGDGHRMYGIPEPIRVWDAHLQQLPDQWRRLPRGSRMRLRTLRHATHGMELLAGEGHNASSAWRHHVRRLADLVERQRYTHLPPREAFGQGFGPLEGPVDKVIFVASHESPEVSVTRIAAEEVAARMAFSLQEERSGFMSYYRKFRFALPAKSNSLIESADAIEHERLRQVLQDKECYAVYHPYPAPIAALFDAIRPLVEA